MVADSKLSWDNLGLALNTLQNEVAEIKSSPKNKKYDDELKTFAPDYKKDSDLATIVDDYDTYTSNIKIYGNSLLPYFNNNQELTVLFDNAVDLDSSLETLNILFMVMVQESNDKSFFDINLPIKESEMVPKIKKLLEFMMKKTESFDTKNISINFEKMQKIFTLNPIKGATPDKKLLNYIKNIFPLMGNLSLFPDIYNKINIPINLKEIFDEFAIPEYDIFDLYVAVIDNYINDVTAHIENNFDMPENRIKINNMINVVRNIITKMIHVFEINTTDVKWETMATKLQTEKNLIDNLPTNIVWSDIVGVKTDAMMSVLKIANKLITYSVDKPGAIDGLNNAIIAYTNKIAEMHDITDSDKLLKYFTNQGVILSISLIETLYEYLSSTYSKLIGNSLMGKDLSLQYPKIKNLSDNVISNNVKVQEIKLRSSVKNIPDIVTDLTSLFTEYDNYKNAVVVHSLKQGEIPTTLDQKHKLDDDTIIETRKFKGIFLGYKTLSISCLQLLIDKTNNPAPILANNPIIAGGRKLFPFEFTPGQRLMMYTFTPTIMPPPLFDPHNNITRGKVLDNGGGDDLIINIIGSDIYNDGAPLNFTVPFQIINFDMSGQKIPESTLKKFITLINTVETCVTLIPIILDSKKRLDEYKFKSLAPLDDPSSVNVGNPVSDKIYIDNVDILINVAKQLSSVNFTIMNTPDVFYLRGIKIDNINIFETVIKAVSSEWKILVEPALFRNTLDTACLFLAHLTVFYHSYIINLCIGCIKNGSILNPNDLIRGTIKENIKFTDAGYTDLLDLSSYEVAFDGIHNSVEYVKNEILKISNNVGQEMIAKPLSNPSLDTTNVYRYFFSNKQTPSSEYFRIMMLTDDKTVLKDMTDLNNAFSPIVKYVYDTNLIFDPTAMETAYNSVLAVQYPKIAGDTIDNNLIFQNIWKAMIDGPIKRFVNLLSPIDFLTLRDTIKDDFDMIVGGKYVVDRNGNTATDILDEADDPDLIIANDFTVTVMWFEMITFDEDLQRHVHKIAQDPLNTGTGEPKDFVRAIMSFIYADINRVAGEKGFDKLKYDHSYPVSLMRALKVPYDKFKYAELRTSIKNFQTIIDSNIYLSDLLGLATISAIELLVGDAAIPKTKFMIFNKQEKYINAATLKQLEYADSVLTTLTSKLDISKDNTKNYSTFLKQQKEIIDIMTATNVSIQAIVRNERNTIESKISEFNYVVSIMSQVMFNKYYAETPFMKLDKLNDYLFKITEHFTSSQKKVKDRLINMMNMHQEYILGKNQANNYLLFIAMAGKKVAGSTRDSKFYVRMGFGLIDYYWDVIHSILNCMIGKKKMVYDNFSEIEKYFYSYHWITIQQCYKLFGWIRDVYMPMKAREEVGLTLAPNERYITKKIELSSLGGAVGEIFAKFQALREYLDQYQSVVMQKVSIHLRINDFKTNPDDTGVRNFAVYEPDYIDNKENRVFTNDKGYLQVHMDKVTDSDSTGYPNGIDKPNQEKFFENIYDRMNNVDGDGKKGIRFKRIYDTEQFPDASVISNYMSLASNIMQGNGTMLMTYGYSGTGKSFTMFGRSTGGDNIQGILQATLQAFSNKIYFRTYEIYGLGTRFNSYWNPQNCGPVGGPNVNECPNISCDIGDYVYQMIIHHKLKVVGKDIEDEGSVPITNQHDMLAYIMEMVKPEVAVHEMQTEMQEGYVDSVPVVSNAASLAANRNIEFQKLLKPDQKFQNSVFIEINKDQFEKFDQIVKKIDALRKSGVTNNYMDEQTFHQIKATLNNPESSRSILVYEFQIEVKIGGNTVTVPFIIYDLPGKEELVKTYIGDNIIDNTEYNNKTKQAKLDHIVPAVFPDLNEPLDLYTDTKIGTKLIKDKKITFTMNPYLIPSYCSDTEINNIITKLEDIDNKISKEWLEEFFKKKVVDSGEFNNYHVDPNDLKLLKNEIAVSNILNNNVINFKTYFELTNVDPAKIDRGDAMDVIEKIGLIEYYSRSGDVSVQDKIFQRYLLVLLIWKLMQYKAIDVIVLIIETALGSREGWKKENIHAFFEAMYINENVVGLIQYLITEVMNKREDPPPFVKQIAGSIIKVGCNSSCSEISKYLLINNMFRQIKHQVIQDPNDIFEFNYFEGFSVDNELLKTAGKSPYQRDKINDFIATYSHPPVGMGPNGEFEVHEPGDPDTGKKIKPLWDFYREYIYLDSVVYDGNKIFRDGDQKIACDPTRINNESDVGKVEWIVDPNSKFTEPKLTVETNRPLLQDFLEPYKEKIKYYYLFYLVTNNDPMKKGKEQINLLNNSYNFINILDSADTDACSK